MNPRTLVPTITAGEKRNASDADHDAEIDAVVTDHNAEVDAADADHNAEVDAVDADHNAEVDAAVHLGLNAEATAAWRNHQATGRCGHAHHIRPSRRPTRDNNAGTRRATSARAACPLWGGADAKPGSTPADASNDEPRHNACNEDTHDDSGHEQERNLAKHA
jgi:hypothetical protein